MRIAHVVTYVSPEGSFGGPVTVASGQCGELARRGHQVSLLAAAPVPKVTSREVDGYIETLFPARYITRRFGFAAMFAPGLVRHLRSGETPDVAHIHMARDLVTLPAARAMQSRGIPTFIQPHGMIDRSSKRLAAVIDAAMTRRALRAARAVFALTESEASEISLVAPEAAISAIRNGIHLEELPPYEDRRDEVVFIARLHPRKRVLAFVGMARLLASEFQDVVFSVYGPDEGDGAALLQAIGASGLSDRIRWHGPLPHSLVGKVLGAARAFVLPSIDEIFPMTILESFLAGTPVVCTHSLGIVEDLRRYEAALITDGSEDALATAVASVLRGGASQLRAGGHQYLREELDIERVGDHLESMYAIESSAA